MKNSEQTPEQIFRNKISSALINLISEMKNEFPEIKKEPWKYSYVIMSEAFNATEELKQKIEIL